MKRLFVEKKPAHRHHIDALLKDLREQLNLPALKSLRLLQRYDIDGIDDDTFQRASSLILAEPQVDDFFPEISPLTADHYFAVEYLPGQFDQRADSAAQAIQILTEGQKPEVFSAQVYLLQGKLSEKNLAKIKAYLINPVDSHEVPVLEKTTRPDVAEPADVPLIHRFTIFTPEELFALQSELGLAMSQADLAHTQAYFRDEEKRDPSLTEIRMLDTYWSDHCRHTTFLTKIDRVTFDDDTEVIQKTYQTYLDTKKSLAREDKPTTLMDIALIGMRELRASGELDNLEISEEINAASIEVEIQVQSLIDNSNSPDHPLSNENLDRLPKNLATQARKFIQAANDTRGIPTDGQSGTGPESALAQRAREKEFLIHPDFTSDLGEPDSNSTSEHEIWLQIEKGRVLKRTWPGVFGQVPMSNSEKKIRAQNATPAEYLARMAMHIAVFESDLEFCGVTYSEKESLIIGHPKGEPSLVITQELIVPSDTSNPHPNWQEISHFMERRDFSEIPNSQFGWSRPDGLAVLDAKPDNFILTSKGVVPIDLQISLIPSLQSEKWLVQFKNETHNHPTEIEPFGGAATCLGGCIRDPLSGRSYVYQAMRVTGAANPLTPYADTIAGKLPQSKICREAAHGYSSYGNQIGLATGQVAEIYHPGYAAKRLEIGAVVAAAPKKNVFRGTPANGDIILLIGGRTGRDGVGGATGSSKEHSDDALDNSAEVQKGNPPTERKIQRLFRHPELAPKIKICNDFGAGGVAVAIGEIAPSLEIDLDAVPKKYDGLDGTELAISESQERMAVCVDPADVDYFIAESEKENLECVPVAKVTDTGRLRMTWRGKTLVDLSRAFLDTNGVQQSAQVHITRPHLTPIVSLDHEQSSTLLEQSSPSLLRKNLGAAGERIAETLERVYQASQRAGIPQPKKDLHDENVILGEDGETLHFIDPVIYQRPADLAIPVAVASVPSGYSSRQAKTTASPNSAIRNLKSAFLNRLSDLNHCSQKGLGEMFDSTIGAATVLSPFGGKNQLTAPDAMVAKIPLLEGHTDACTFMAWGFDPFLSCQSPFHGAAHAVTDSVCKAVSAGARLSDIRLTLQEFFPKLGDDPARWGLPFAALLGAFNAQHGLRLAAIGGKDSMSGSFNDLDVPPTLVSFALAPGLATNATSPEFKTPGNQLSLVELPLDPENLPNYSALQEFAETFHKLIEKGKIASAKYLGQGGLAPALATSAFGNDLGVELTNTPDLFAPRPCHFLIEHEKDLPAPFQKIGQVIPQPELRFQSETVPLATLKTAWQKTLEPIFPTQSGINSGAAHGPNSGLDVPSKVKSTNSGLDVPSIARDVTSQPANSTNSEFKIQNSKFRPQVLIPVFPGNNCEYDSARVFREAGGDPQINIFRNLTPQHIEESLRELAQSISQSQILMLPGGFSAGDEPDGSAKFIATVLRNPRVADAIMDLLKNRDGLIFGICNGFQALVKTGLLPHGEIITTTAESATPAGDASAKPQGVQATLTHNTIGRHISTYVTTRVTNTNSPWLQNSQIGDLHTLPVSHGEGRFIAPQALLEELTHSGQIAFQYVDPQGNPTMAEPYNPNGSDLAIEGLTSPCGRILGKMAHSERRAQNVAKNIPGNKHQSIFQAGVDYFAK